MYCVFEPVRELDDLLYSLVSDRTVGLISDSFLPVSAVDSISSVVDKNESSRLIGIATRYGRLNKVILCCLVFCKCCKKDDRLYFEYLGDSPPPGDLKRVSISIALLFAVYGGDLINVLTRDMPVLTCFGIVDWFWECMRYRPCSPIRVLVPGGGVVGDKPLSLFNVFVMNKSKMVSHLIDVEDAFVATGDILALRRAGVETRAADCICTWLCVVQLKY